MACATNYEYGPFGELIRTTGPMAKLNPFRFSTKYYDWETGLNYYGYRYYNPSTGRWLSRDPLEEEGGEGLYVWAANDPGTHIDLYGLQCRQITGSFGLPFEQLTFPAGVFISFDESLNGSLSFTGEDCDCCGHPHTKKAKGTITVQGNAQVGMTVGKIVNQTVLGINFMGFAGLRLAGSGAIEGSGSFTRYCDGTSSADFKVDLTAGLTGQVGLMLSDAYPRGWPRRLTGPLWGPRFSVGVVGEGKGMGTDAINVHCENATCYAYSSVTATASADVKATLGFLSASFGLGSWSHTWNGFGSQPYLTFGNPFN